MSLKTWLAEIFEPSLIMSILLVLLGTVTAFVKGYFNLLFFLLCLLGGFLVQNSVNLLNDYYDYIAGIDTKTTKTPFTGGSKIVANGLLNSSSVYKVGVISLICSILIGVFFTLTVGLLLLPILILGGISSYFYTSFFARQYLGEFMAGLNLGPLMVLGTYFIQTGSYTLEALSIGIAPGIMIANVLFLHEFPDMEFDMAAGRKNLVTFLGRERASKLYVCFLAIAYFWIIISALLNITPYTTLIGLITLPISIKAGRIVLKNHSNIKELVPGLAANILTTFLTIALLVIGMYLSILI
jgi:1,4-dihydroxy-2-naphthoate octaprenyltransferase